MHQSFPGPLLLCVFVSSLQFRRARRRAAETPEARAEAVKLSAREKEMFARSSDHHANIAGFAPATCISLGYAAPYPCHPLAPPMTRMAP